MFHHAARSRKPIVLKEGGTKSLNRFVKARLLTLLLAVCLILTAIPAYAAEDNSVTVYFTLTSDGVPVRGNDSAGTVLARHKVKVPYFDLGLYGLGNFYRYETDGDFGQYINKVIVKKPTVLHLYIYMLERYYQGLSASECGKGYLDMSLKKTARDINGKTVSQGKEALYITGGACSLYMANFWGHDENLMYFVDHQYPLMNPGWGSTSDYILLKEGMDVDVAMFSNWGFYHDGSFMYFERDAYTVSANTEQELRVLGGKTSVVTDGSFTPVEPQKGMEVYIWENPDEPGTMTGKKKHIETTDSNGRVYYDFPKAGTYLVSAEDPNQGGADAAHAIATTVVTVMDTSVALESISFDKEKYILAYGNTGQIEPSLSPANATDVILKWESADPNVAKVNDIGVLYAVGSGETTITCTATQGTQTCTASFDIFVGDVVKVQGIELQDEVTIEVGESLALEYNITPADANVKSALWRTSDCDDWDTTYSDEDFQIAKVNHLGVVTGKKPGTVLVYVKTNDGGFIDSCKVTVVPSTKPQDISNDSKVNSVDAVLILQNKLTEDQKALADYNHDGKVNKQDAIYLLEYIAGN